MDFTQQNLNTVASYRANPSSFLGSLPAIAARVSGYRPSLPRASALFPNAVFLGKITDTAPFASEAWVEKWVLQSEGVCGTGITLYLPPVESAPDSGVPPSMPRRSLVLITMNESFAAVEPPTGPPLAYTFVSDALARGVGVALVSLCGFGEMGPATPTESFWNPENGNLASFNGRSVVGFHAGELSRSIAWLENRPDIREVSAIVACNSTDAAALHAAASDSILHNKLKALVTVSALAQYADVAASKFYATSQIIDVPGVLSA